MRLFNFEVMFKDDFTFFSTFSLPKNALQNLFLLFLKIFLLECRRSFSKKIKKETFYSNLLILNFRLVNCVSQLSLAILFRRIFSEEYSHKFEKRKLHSKKYECLKKHFY